jgi:hypothetical protein
MTTGQTAVAQQSISWAARLLIDKHGDHAPSMAARCVSDMERAGRDDLACVWEMVCQMTKRLIAAQPMPTSAAVH